MLDFFFHVYEEDILEQYDYIISFINGKILSKEVINKARIASINFHTCPPKYPGTGGYSYALYNGDNKFGVTCHHTDEYIDHGKIIKVDWFRIAPNETINSLLEKAHKAALKQFVYMITLMFLNKPFPKCSYEWRKKMDYKRNYMKIINKRLEKIKPEVFK